MKKLFVLLLSSLVLVYGAISASAYASPGVDGNNNGKTDSDGNGSSQGTNNNTSPKTGSTSTYAVLMAGAALAFGGVAAGAKKKLGE